MTAGGRDDQPLASSSHKAVHCAISSPLYTRTQYLGNRLLEIDVFPAHTGRGVFKTRARARIADKGRKLVACRAKRLIMATKCYAKACFTRTPPHPLAVIRWSFSFSALLTGKIQQSGPSFCAGMPARSNILSEARCVGILAPPRTLE